MPNVLGDVIRVVAQLLSDAEITIQNVFYLKIGSAGPIDDADLIDDMGEYLEDVYDGLVGYLHTTTTFDLYKMTNVTDDSDKGAHSWPVLTAGSNGSERYAPGVCGLIRARTGTPGREGRKFFGPLTEGILSNGLIASTPLAALAAAGVSAYAQFTSSNGYVYQPIVYDRVLDVGRTPTETVATANPAYQRRRRRGRGV
jgi:hypothetical protein